MLNGVVIKGIASFYYVKVEDKIYECKARGKFKKQKKSILVGDRVNISVNDDKGVIEDILPRDNELFRPAVANIDQALIVFSLKNPEPHLNLLDKLLILSEYVGIDVIICLNKLDIDTDEIYKSIKSIYEPIGYKVILSSTVGKIGQDELYKLLEQKTTVLAGPSGVGKSSIMNMIQSNVVTEVGEISEKIKRGKHTTRHSELIPLNNGGYVVDTPGFSSLNIEFISDDELDKCYPEINNYANDCKFSDCLHIKESDCAVKKALQLDKIHSVRYESYMYFMDLLRNSGRKK